MFTCATRFSTAKVFRDALYAHSRAAPRAAFSVSPRHQPMQPVRAEDLSNVCFDDPSYPLTSDTWRDWLSRSAFDTGGTMTLDTTLTEEPHLFVFKNGTRGAVYAINQVAYQVQRTRGVCGFFVSTNDRACVFCGRPRLYSALCWAD